MLIQKARQATIEIITHDWDGAVVAGITVYEKKLPEIPKELDRAQDLMGGHIHHR